MTKLELLKRLEEIKDEDEIDSILMEKTKENDSESQTESSNDATLKELEQAQKTIEDLKNKKADEKISLTSAELMRLLETITNKESDKKEKGGKEDNAEIYIY